MTDDSVTVYFSITFDRLFTLLVSITVLMVRSEHLGFNDWHIPVGRLKSAEYTESSVLGAFHLGHREWLTTGCTLEKRGKRSQVRCQKDVIIVYFEDLHFILTVQYERS